MSKDKFIFITEDGKVAEEISDYQEAKARFLYYYVKNHISVKVIRSG